MADYEYRVVEEWAGQKDYWPCSTEEHVAWTLRYLAERPYHDGPRTVERREVGPWEPVSVPREGENR